MKQTMNTQSYKLLLLFCLLTLSVAAFAAPEAEYKKLAKTYTLNADGSQEYRCDMELTLFTHTAMNGTYGESFIVYNPLYQEVKIHASYTRQKDGTLVKTPNNAFVEVLPRNAADAPAYNHLKELVVVHTGLELGATIYLDYSVYSKPGYLPALDIYEELLQSSPVKAYTATIVVPVSAQLAFDLQHLAAKPQTKVSGDVQTVSWTLRNLPAASREPFVSAANGDVPFLTASTFGSEAEALQTLYKQFNPSNDSQIAAIAESVTEGKEAAADKLQAILGYLNKHYATSRLTLEETGFRIRPADAVISSAYGTAAEKTNLLSGLLNAAGIKAEPVALYRTRAAQGSCGLKATHELYVVASVADKRYLLSPTSDRMATASRMGNRVPSVSLATGQAVEIEAPASDVRYEAVITLTDSQAEIQATSTQGEALRPLFSTASNTRTSDVPLKAANGYIVLTLPDADGSLAGSHFCQLNSKREQNLLMPHPVNEQCSYAITLPDGMEMRTPASNKTVANAAGQVVISVQKEGKTAQVTRSLQLNKQLYTPAEYAALRALLTEWGGETGKSILLKNR